MEETEKYGVKVEAETEDFKKQMKDLADTSKKASQEIKNNLKLNNLKESFGDFSTIFKTEVVGNIKKGFQVVKDTIRESYATKDIPIFTNYDKQIELVQYKINELINTIEKLKAEDSIGNKQEILEYEAQVEKLKISLNGLYDKRIDILSWEETEQYIKNLEEELKKCELQFESLSLASKKTPEQIANYEIMKNKITDLKFELETARDTLREVNEEGNKINKAFNGLGAVISKGFKDANRNIKRLTLSMVGVHSAYYVLSRAVSTYSQYDIETTNKMKSAWASLGAFLAPIVQTIATLVQKAVGYLNVFITALTGTNYIKKANEAYKYSQSVKEIGKNAKEATKSLTAMDEITNIPDNKLSGADSDDTVFNPFEAIENVELNPEWVKRMEDLGKYLKPVYEKILDLVQWAKENPEVIASILGAGALLVYLGKVLGYAGAGTVIGTGLAGIYGVLLGIVALSAIVISITILTKNFNELIAINDYVINQAQTLSDKYDEALDKLKEYIRTVDKKDPKFGEEKNKWIKNATSGIEDIHSKLQEVKDFFKKNFEDNIMWRIMFGITGYKDAGNIFNWLSGNDKRNSAVLMADIKGTYTYIEALKEAYDQGKLNEDEVKEYKKLLNKFLEAVDETGYGVEGYTKTVKLNKEQTKELSKMYGTAKTSLEKFGDSTTKTKDKVKTSTDKMKSDISSVKKEVDKIPTNKTIKFKLDANKISSQLVALGNSISKLAPEFALGGFMSWINQLRSYDVGTPYVPEDGLAMIHKGERIIPAKYNNESLFNNTSNETTNALLVELIQAVEENGDKVPVFNINGKEFAKATYSDYQDESNRLNKNTMIRRV